MDTQRAFYRRQSKGRVVACFLAVCALDGAVVAAGAFHPEWFKRNKPVQEELIEVPFDDAPPPPELVVPEDQPDDSTPEPTPEETPPMEEETPPPPEPDAQFVDPTPSATPEKPKNVPKFTGTIPPNAKRGPTYVPGVVGGVPNGTPGGKVGGKGKWMTPKPPYPPQARQMKITGSGSFRVTTDASGNVTSCSTVQSINPILDNAVKSYAPGHWKGPPSSTSTVPVTFQLQ
ncbi:MAG: energy transducer TonB [Verrucomicrobia bacterium]|nr:energy transducer TonB [Verrucomicrobiota bacterium]